PGFPAGKPANSGAHEWNRTIDLLLTKEVLYRLSYVSTGKTCLAGTTRCGAMERETGIEPAPSAWKAEVLPLNYSREGNRSPGLPLRALPCCSVTALKLVEGGGFEPPKA